MDFHKYIGLHIRLKDSLLETAQEAEQLGIKTFQFFLSASQKKNVVEYISVSPDEKQKFITLVHNTFTRVYVHSSYWINPASGKIVSYENSKGLLKKEINLAQQLGLEYLVLHPGSATWHQPTPTDPLCKQAGIDALTRMINTLAKDQPNITIILENTAHGNRAIGSDFHDFLLIREKIDRPEKLRFCVDLAHAFAYGYNLEDIENFTQLIDTTMGLENLELIHFNDSQENFGSKKDKHAYPGYGMIGKKILTSYLHHPALKTVNKILEIPQTSTELSSKIIAEVFSWVP